MARARVKVVSETSTGLNNKAVRGEVNGCHGVKNSDGTKFIRSNPDKSTNNNLDK